MTLPVSHLAVLEAMTRPDPRPSRDPDNPVAAIARRMPGAPLEELAHAVRVMNARGLTCIPFVLGNLDPQVTRNPRDWITEMGWRVLQQQRADPEPASGEKPGAANGR